MKISDTERVSQERPHVAVQRAAWGAPRSTPSRKTLGVFVAFSIVRVLRVFRLSQRNAETFLKRQIGGRKANISFLA